MSFEFSRRNFMKYTAVAAVALAGASLFTGCKDSGDSFNLLKEGAGELTVLQVTAAMGKYDDKSKKYTAPAITDATTTIEFPMKITNNRTNPIYVNPTNFKAVVYDKDNKVVKKYNYYSGITFDSNLYETNLAKGSSVSGKLTVNLGTDKLTDGQYIVLTYCPDLQYNEYSLNWKLTVSK